ncbi:MAG: biotin--[acetyl-CoA-carboxylase] ligase [Acidobacteria bacterium]|nr:biotin--[acetyl-CoA-carboxylase] ligase [Acidobacteriota bacterium]
MPLDIARIRQRLPDRPVHYFESAESTMTEAARLLSGRCPPGTLVVAERQTEGRGRLGRVWHSEPDGGLYLSIVLRPALPWSATPPLTLALGLATAEAIQRTTGLATDLRWPNDVMLGERKSAGILVEFEGSFAVAGIGVNVNQASFPAEIAAAATSLRLVSGVPQSREDLLLCLVDLVDEYCALLREDGAAKVMALFSAASSYACGRRVRVEVGGELIVGTTAGLDECGFLRVRRDDGEESLILAGGVRPA